MASPSDSIVRHDIPDRDIEKNAAEIDKLLRATGRPGIDAFADWLKTTDFYTAPASSKFHLNCVGGLAAHSLNVYHALRDLVERGLVKLDDDTVVITSLLHDLCKANFYRKERRPVFADGETREHEVWVIDDPFPVGHGEKSCYYVQRYIQLTEEEYAMIRLHMGSGGGYPDPYTASAMIHPGVTALHIADMTAAGLVER